MDWITENIAIGNFVDALSVSTTDVDAILCLKDDCCAEDDASFYVSHTPLVDGAGNDPWLVEEAVAFIDSIVRSGKKVLVLCHAGRSRSVCIVARYLVEKKGISVRSALSLIRTKRDVHLSPGTSDILDVNA